MADDVTLPLTGSGDATAVVAAEEAGGKKYQLVKLVDGTATGTGRIGGDATNGLDVDVTRVQGTVTVDASGAAVPVTDNGGSLTVDDGGSSLTVDNAHLTSLGGAVAGTEVQVDVVASLPAGNNNIGDVDVASLPSLPAGTNAIGKLAANSGVDIGDVDVTSIVPGTGATSLGKAEDAAHSTGDTGVMALAVRTDTAAARAGTDGDYAPLEVDASGRLHVVNSAGVGGTVAHDAADSGNPVKVGGKAFAGANLTAVADGDRADLRVDNLGRVVVTPYQTRGHIVHQATTITNSTAETTILAAAASTFHDLVSLHMTNAGAADVTVTIKDAAAGTTRATYFLKAGGGGVFTFPLPLTQAVVNTAWNATLSVNTVTVHIVVVAVKNV